VTVLTPEQRRQGSIGHHGIDRRCCNPVARDSTIGLAMLIAPRPFNVATKLPPGWPSRLPSSGRP
jgi:hypothetical protein